MDESIVGRNLVVPMTPVRPTAAFCFGRHALAEDVISYAGSEGSVLLYGGPQSGKTTLLLYVEKVFKDRIPKVIEFGEYEIGVYVDARGKLGRGAGPSEFFSFLGELAVRSCSGAVAGFDARSLDRFRVATAEDLQQRLDDIGEKISGIIARVVFLVDDSKCVLEWSREFHNNLNSLLYGGSERQMDVAIVFAGGKELQALLIDTTSPIGGRAVPLYIANLGSDDISDMLSGMYGRGSGEIVCEVKRNAAVICRYTGGHAGLSSRAARRLVAEESVGVGCVVQLMERQSSELFRQWNSGFTDTTMGFLSVAAANDRLSRSLVREHVRPEQVERVWRELQYMGVAIAEGEWLLRVNRLFWEQWMEVGSVATPGGVVDHIDSAIELIEGGESDGVEFKSTLRTAVGAGERGMTKAERKKISRKLEHVILKSVAGLLNTDGGVVFVGVDDVGEAVDLAVDGFTKDDGSVDQDGMTQHLVNIMKERMDPIAAIWEYSRTQFITHQERPVLMVSCRKANVPVFVEKRFFRRVGTTTQEVDGADLWNHLVARYPESSGASRADTRT